MSEAADIEAELRDSTECTICGDVFSEPKFLPCHHTFCLHCLETWCKKSCKCPLCRKSFDVPNGGCAALQTNFYVERQCRVLRQVECLTAAAAADRNKCDGCPDKAAELRCRECEKLFCTKCGDLHRQKRHQHKMSAINTRNCGYHPRRTIEFYCKECLEPGCATCRTERHRGHSVSDIEEVGGRFRSQLVDDLTDATAKMVGFGEASATLENAEVELMQRIANTKRQICEESDKLKSKINFQTDELQQQLAVEKRKALQQLKAARDGLDVEEEQLKRFVTKCDKIISDRTTWDVVQEFQDLHSKGLQLKIAGEPCAVRKWTLEFAASNLEMFLPSERKKNLVGRILTASTDADSDVPYDELMQKLKEIVGEKDRKLKEMQDQRDQASNEKRRLNLVLVTSQVENADLAEQLAFVTDELGRLRFVLMTKQAEAKQETERLEASVKQTECNNAVLRMLLADSQMSEKDLQRRLNDAQAEKRQVDERLEAAERKEGELCEEIANLCRRGDDLDRQVNTANEQISQLKWANIKAWTTVAILFALLGVVVYTLC